MYKAYKVRLYKKIKETRRFNLINVVNKIVKESDIIVSENLNIKNMIDKNKCIAKNLLDVTLNKVIELLKWKTLTLGKYYYQVDTYFPSSQLCSHCGTKNEQVKDLSVRNWCCKSCHFNNDRDINASINIMFEGLKLHYQNNF